MCKATLNSFHRSRQSELHDVPHGGHGAGGGLGEHDLWEAEGNRVGGLQRVEKNYMGRMTRPDSEVV